MEVNSYCTFAGGTFLMFRSSPMGFFREVIFALTLSLAITSHVSSTSCVKVESPLWAISSFAPPFNRGMPPLTMRPPNERNIGVPSEIIMTCSSYPSPSKGLDDLAKRPWISLPKVPTILSTKRTRKRSCAWTLIESYGMIRLAWRSMPCVNTIISDAVPYGK